MDWILEIDKYLFFIINHGLANPLFDKIMPFITEVDSWVLVYLVGFWYLFFKSGKVGKITAISLIITILVADQVSSSLIKEWVGRIRPCHDLDSVRLLVNCGGGKSFPSSHAVNNFAAAFVITHYFRKNFTLFFGIAFLMAFSRVYIGVHYPFDILCGSILGIFVAFIVTYIIDYINKKINFDKNALKTT
ncbi:MAG TPA: phosphatase PAP2 family protein [Candidatus Kapabacteria bacterium]|nr:phosphatase PAP2 family protein [Candidatus Kapabacteria bacterium]